MGALRRAGRARSSSRPATRRTPRLMAVGHAKYTGEVGVMTSHAGARRGPPAQRPVRRQARPRAGRGDRRAAADDGARLGVPAGDRPAERCSRTWRRSTSQTCSRPSRADGPRPGLPDGARDALAVRGDRPARRPAGLRRPEELPHEHGIVPTAPGWRAPRRAADRGGPGRGGRGPQRRGAGGAAGRAGRPGRPATRSAAVAERLGAGVTTSLLGKPWWDETLPFSCRRDGPPRHHRVRRGCWATATRC